MKLTRILLIALLTLLAVSGFLACSGLSESGGTNSTSPATSSSEPPATTTTVQIVITDPVIGWSETVNYPASAAHANDHAARASEQGWTLLNKYLSCVDPAHEAVIDGDPETSVGCSNYSEQKGFGELSAEFTVEPNVELQIYAVAIRYADNRILGNNSKYQVRLGYAGGIKTALEHLDVNDTFVPAEDGILLMPSDTVYIELFDNAPPQSITSLNAYLSLLQDGAVVDISFYGTYVIYP